MSIYDVKTMGDEVAALLDAHGVGDRVFVLTVMHKPNDGTAYRGDEPLTMSIVANVQDQHVSDVLRMAADSWLTMHKLTSTGKAGRMQ